jgi:hypothetical protein
MPLRSPGKVQESGISSEGSQTPFGLLERSKVAVSSLKGKSQTPVSRQRPLKSREQKQQPQQRGAEYTHLAITDTAVIAGSASVVAVKKGGQYNARDTAKKNDVVRKLVED